MLWLELLIKGGIEIGKAIENHQHEYYKNHLSKEDIEFVNAMEEGLEQGGYMFPNSLGITYEHYDNLIFLLEKVDCERAKMHQDKYYSKRLF